VDVVRAGVVVVEGVVVDVVVVDVAVGTNTLGVRVLVFLVAVEKDLGCLALSRWILMRSAKSVGICASCLKKGINILK
jgi:hypothetical protein